MFFDSHAHLHDPKFERDLERVLDRAKVAGVDRVITLGDSVAASRKAVALARRAPEVLAAVGVHPHAAAEWSDECLGQIEELLETPRVVAVGEIGLDYHHHHFGHEKQRHVFRSQLALARKHRLPVSMHCRESYADMIEDLRNSHGDEIGGVCHCFSGTAEDAKALTEMGFFLGVGGTITYPKADELRSAIRGVGVQWVLLETDSPYLAPQSRRGRRNEPANLPITARAVAELLGETYRDIARITTYNTERAFRLSREHAPQCVYVIANQIHVNITNACTNNCDFCIRHGDGIYRGHQVRLETPPDVDDIFKQVMQAGFEPYRDVVFGGLGESLFRIDEILTVAKAAKQAGKRTILQTNGHGALIHGGGIWDRLEGVIDIYSVSLNAPDEKTYNSICHPIDPEHAFGATLDFVREGVRRGVKIAVTALDLPEVDIAATRALAAELGVELYVHSREPVFEEEVVR